MFVIVVISGLNIKTSINKNKALQTLCLHLATLFVRKIDKTVITQP